MSEEQALVPIEQKTVNFQGDDITAVLVETEEGEQVFVPVRPICDYLGVTWGSQYNRITRDPVLSDVVRNISVFITKTDIDPESRRPHTSEMLCLPLEFLHGWLFGINASRVKEEIKDNLIRYQRDCYKILAQAFLERAETAVSPTMSALAQIRDNALAVAALAEQQMEHERRISASEIRLDRAASVVGELGRRVRLLEQRTAPGHPIGEEQAAEITQRIKALAGLLTEKDPGKNHYQSVFNEIYRLFGVTSYKLIPQAKYEAVLEFLDEWRGRITK